MEQGKNRFSLICKSSNFDQDVIINLKVHEMKILVFVFTGLLAFTIIGCVTNPVTGEEEFMIYGSGYEQDVAMGANVANQIEKNLGGALENEQLQNYINYVGQKIANVSHASELKFKYKALKDDSANALALPGGYIYITMGMLEQLRNEAQLAAIFAHETAHITVRHTASAMSRLD